VLKAPKSFCSYKSFLKNIVVFISNLEDRLFFVYFKKKLILSSEQTSWSFS